MTNTFAIFADRDIVEGIRLYLGDNRAYEFVCDTNSFEECRQVSKSKKADAVILQLQIESDVASCLNLMHEIDRSDYPLVILLFEKISRNKIIFTATDSTLNLLANHVSECFEKAVGKNYAVNYALFRPATMGYDRLVDSALGKDEALLEIIRGCSKEESDIYKKLYTLDLRDNGYYLFFWELQNLEYHDHFCNKDVYNMMGRILEKKYMSILHEYEGGEAFRIGLDKRCLIINDLTMNREAIKHAKLEELIPRLFACGNCRTASNYISERVDILKNLRYARDRYENEKGKVFFIRYAGVMRASKMSLHQQSQKSLFDYALPVVQKINNYISYDIMNPALIEELRKLYFDIIKPSMSYALYYYCVASICSNLAKLDKEADIGVLADGLSPEQMRFSSIEEQYDIMIKHISVTKKRIGNSRKTRNSIVRGAIDYIAENYCRDVSVPEIASELYVSHMYLSQLFRDVTGTSVINYIVKFRIEKAKEMLEESDRPIYGIAESVGFHDIKHFSKTFKKVVGTSPSAYRKQIMAQQHQST
jgi:YesN/AraC family two-component response regulator